MCCWYTLYNTCVCICLFPRVIQDQLPQQGLKKPETEEANPPCQMDMLYDEYIQEEQRKNWKFWIVSFVITAGFRIWQTCNVSDFVFVFKLTD